MTHDFRSLVAMLRHRLVGALSLGFVLAAGLSRLSAVDDGQRVLSIDHYVAIYGSHGTLRLGWKQSTYKQAGSSEWVVFGHGYDKVMCFRRQIENFSAAIQGAENLLITAEDAVASVEAIQAGYRALRDRCWTPVGHVEENVWLDGMAAPRVAATA